MNENSLAGRFTGLALALLAAVVFWLWWVGNGIQPNALSSGIGAALAALVIVHAVLLAIREGSRAPVALAAIGLWIFLGVAAGGLLLAATAAGDDVLRPTPLNLRMVFVAVFVAVYAVLVVAVRHWWIVLPVAHLVDGFGEPAGGRRGGGGDADGDDGARPGLLTDGYFMRERRAALARRLEGVDAEDPVRLRLEATAAYALARDDAGLTEAKASLRAGLTEAPPAGSGFAQLVFPTRAVLVHVHGRGTGSAIYLWKVQNQLFACAVILLGAVAFFGAHGWAAPMSVAAVAAIIVRVRSLVPLGDPGAYDGGARWMTLFMTPLVGAVSAVIGLTLIAALSELELLNEDLPEVIGLSSGVWLGTEAPAFGVLALGLAAAFGWSAKMLDTMLATLTARVGHEEEGDGSGGSGGAGGAAGAGGAGVGGAGGAGGAEGGGDPEGTAEAEAPEAPETPDEPDEPDEADETDAAETPEGLETPEARAGSEGARGSPEDRAARISRLRGARRARGRR